MASLGHNGLNESNKDRFDDNTSLLDVDNIVKYRYLQI